MKIKKVIRGKKEVRMFLKECLSCGCKEWKHLNDSTIRTKVCRSCATLFASRNNAPAPKEEFKQDKERDSEMIREWLSFNKPTVYEVQTYRDGVTGCKMDCGA